MKRILTTGCAVLLALTVFAQDKKTETFKVYGNCHMCEERIETSLKKKDGILKKEWDIETKMLTVSYDPAKTDLNTIKHKVAEAGYDSDDVRATDEAYNKLHGCCQYVRPTK